MSNLKERNYSVRINLKAKKTNDAETIRQAELFVKELPRMEGFYVQGYTVYDLKDKKVIKELIIESD